jgi:hypothetical protein
VCISAAELSTVIPPDCSCFCFSGSFVVRSGEIRFHDCPPSFVTKRNWAPMYSFPFSRRDTWIGVFQFQRSFSR